MADAASESGDIIGSIRTQLEGLKRTEDGMLLYRLIERGLGKRPDDTGGTDEAFLTFLYTLLERYAKNRDGDPITRIKVRVIQQRITPHLIDNRSRPEPEVVEAEPEVVEAEPEVVEAEPEVVEAEPELNLEIIEPEPRPEPPRPVKKQQPAANARQPKKKAQAGPSAGKAVPAPKHPRTGILFPKQTAARKPEQPKKPIKLELVDATDLTKPHVKQKPEQENGYDIELGGDEPMPRSKPTAKKVAANKNTVSPASRKPAARTGPGPAPAGKVQKNAELMPRTSAPARPAANTTNEPSQERVEKLHETFVHKMAESITRSQEYHRLLRSHMKAIELADNENDFRDLKTLILRGMNDLLKGNEALGRDLDSTSHYLKIARLDRALLKDELGRIKDNTTVDELTALQNKDAFIKQLESEISRVNRYGFSFAIAVLDIDDLKSINNSFGRDAGDEVLRCYARQILSQFRSYDLVARHKNDEFLLLFPNTQKEGAIRAVEKAQKRAANLYINYKDKNIKIPTFTSVLTTYTPGDQPETILKRTTEALTQAQKRGRDQVIVALPTS